MTDTERERITAICEVAGVAEIDDLSDGFHTFRQLYYQRMMLFATIVKQNKDKAWKSLRHEDGELCFGGGWFIVGIDTPEGSYTYHYEDYYYSLFDCEELERGKHWDGHTEKDVTRLLSLPTIQTEPHWIPVSERLPEEHESMFAKYYNTPKWNNCMWLKESGKMLVSVEVPGNEIIVDTAKMINGKWFFGLSFIDKKVIAWMPLPKPFEGGIK